MRCLREIASPPKGISGKWRGASYCPVVVAIVSLRLIANTRAFGLTLSDLDPSQHYKAGPDRSFRGTRFFTRRSGLRDDDERAPLVSGLEAASRLRYADVQRRPDSYRALLSSAWILQRARNLRSHSRQGRSDTSYKGERRQTGQSRDH